MAKLDALKHRNSELKILASVGGGGNDKDLRRIWSQVAANSATREFFGKQLLQFVEIHKLDGIGKFIEFFYEKRIYFILNRYRLGISQL